MHHSLPTPNTSTGGSTDPRPAVLHALRLLCKHQPLLASSVYIPAAARLASARRDDDLELEVATISSLEMAGVGVGDMDMSQASTLVSDIDMAEASQRSARHYDTGVDPRAVMPAPVPMSAPDPRRPIPPRTRQVMWEPTAEPTTSDPYAPFPTYPLLPPAAAPIPASDPDLGSAYALLDVSSNMPADAGLFRSCVAVRLEESPGLRDRVIRAVRVVGTHRGWEWAVRWAEEGCPAIADGEGDGGVWEVPVVVEDVPGDAALLGDVPAGLANLGATCYLNSVLQLLFSLRPVRDGVLDEVYGVDVAGSNGGEGGGSASVEDAEVVQVERVEAEDQPAQDRTGKEARNEVLAMRDRLFLTHTANLFARLIFSQSRAVAPAKELVGIIMQPEVEWVDQHLKSVVGTDGTLQDNGPESSNGQSSSATTDQYSLGMQQDMTEAMDSVNGILEKVLTRSASAQPKPATQHQSDSESSPPPTSSSSSSLTAIAASSAASIFRTISGGKRKRDASVGASRTVTEDVQQGWVKVDPDAASSSAPTTLVQTLFYGTVTQHLSYHPPDAEAPKTATKEESFSHLLVQAHDTLVSSLDAYFGEAQVTYEGDAAARRHVVLARTPPVLTIILNRVQFDAGQGRSWKSNVFTEFPAHLDVGRFEHPWDSRKKVIEKEQELRNEIAMLEIRMKEAGNPEEFEQTLQFVMNDITVPPTIREQNVEGLMQQVHEARRVKEDELKTVWDELSTEDSKYALHAVLLHEGEAMFGHYWIFIHDPSGPFGPRWLKYNDTMVTPVDPAEVFRDRGGNANAYCLVYVRQEEINSIVDVFTRFQEVRDEYVRRFPSIPVSFPDDGAQMDANGPTYGPDLPPNVQALMDPNGDVRMADRDGREMSSGLASEA
ncbi:cysteine proteinase [Gonapodya prolifera JEL478]|uniref:Ubiquitin carboxyl-terminal hydrolase n=1 Tax=Gonapodya prolifera (strain JEL478) TaxID=1344416 RepID=A0A139AUP5_GONPJ|nr:cysteine proteinase [Gonapodya prolifera JEL478]|eukprot:KXS20438.1 cysteine proteinase [Gonapodya prolifera JEL478]